VQLGKGGVVGRAVGHKHERLGHWGAAVTARFKEHGVRTVVRCLFHDGDFFRRAAVARVTLHGYEAFDSLSRSGVAKIDKPLCALIHDGFKLRTFL
jgi:hypothetical protein